MQISLHRYTYAHEQYHPLNTRGKKRQNWWRVAGKDAEKRLWIRSYRYNSLHIQPSKLFKNLLKMSKFSNTHWFIVREHICHKPAYDGTHKVLNRKFSMLIITHVLLLGIQTFLVCPLMNVVYHLLLNQLLWVKKKQTFSKPPKIGWYRCASFLSVIFCLSVRTEDMKQWACFTAKEMRRKHPWRCGVILFPPPILQKTSCPSPKYIHFQWN